MNLNQMNMINKWKNYIMMTILNRKMKKILMNQILNKNKIHLNKN